MEERCVEKAVECGVKVVAFDIDQTAVRAHSRGRLARENLEEYLDQVSADFVKIAPLLESAGLGLAIATHSDEAEFGGDVLPETHILGEELARALVKKHLPKLEGKFKIVAYNPRARVDGKQEENAVKRFHMRTLLTHFSCKPQEILFFDDDIGVVEDCLQTCLVRAVHVDFQRGFTLQDMFNALI